VLWKIEESAVYFDRLHLRGWCHIRPGGSGSLRPAQRQSAVSDRQLRARQSRRGGHARPDAAHVRFDDWWSRRPRCSAATFRSARGWTTARASSERRITNAAHGDPYYQSWENFLMQLDAFESGAVLELARARAPLSRAAIGFRRGCATWGSTSSPDPTSTWLATRMSSAACFPGEKFVAVFRCRCSNTSRCRGSRARDQPRPRAGRTRLHVDAPTWPPHEEPWDFWRFNRTTWATLFNAATGFEIVEAVVGEPARIHPCRARRDARHARVAGLARLRVERAQDRRDHARRPVRSKP